MIKVYPFKELGEADHGWLLAKHHFSFAEYYNPKRMGFGVLRVINDDTIQPNSGFDMHPHRDMEIITYVRSGAITHVDNQGNRGVTKAGDVQVMSAGSGIFHSEYNLEDSVTQLYQIWITPNSLNVKPRWEAKVFPKEFVDNELKLMVSGNQDDDALFIHQDAYIFAGRLKESQSINHSIKHQAYILVASGQIEIDGRTINERDGVEITDETNINIKSIFESEILLLDVPNK
jgi:hypothetical protein